MDDQTNLLNFPSVLITPWSKVHGSGLWLHFFTILLIKLLPVGYFSNKEERDAVNDMCKAADYFIVPLGQPYDSTRESWSGQISAAAQGGLGSNTVKEFHKYVLNDRKSVMTFDEVVRCLDENKRYIFSLGYDEAKATAGVQTIANGYLTRLRDLRLAVKKVISFLDIDKPRVAKNYTTNKFYKFNLRKLYEEFKSHYAYETALYIPMY